MPRGKITEWKQSYEYKAILLYLREYWLLEPDELEVKVAMRFTHKDGRTQEKLITWKNPDQYAGKPPKLQPISAAELVKKEFPPDVFPYKYFNKKSNEVKTMTDNTQNTERMEALTTFKYVKQHLDCSDETAALLVVADNLQSLRDTISMEAYENIRDVLER